MRFQPSGPLRGRVTPPADKSVSHRAALLGAMGEGETSVEGYLDAADTNSTLAAVEAVGARVERAGPGTLRIAGVGLRGARSAAIDVGNAGTLMRLLPGWLAGQPQGEWVLDGDESIRRRPVDRVARPLAGMGADVAAEDGLPPLRVRGGQIHGISYEMPIASAQVKSCLLLAGLNAEGETTLTEPAPSRDHTERMLAAAGATVRTEGRTVSVAPAERIEPDRIVVPGDISSAAFFIVAAVLVPGSDLVVEGVGLNPTRTGLITALQRMGADLEVIPGGEQGGEPIGSVRVRHGALAATEIGGDEIPALIDELPLMALAACFAEGETTVRDAAELRRKESDRIATVGDALTALGGEVEQTPDGFVISGTGGLRGGVVDSSGDHRIAMLGAVAGLASSAGVEVSGMEAAAVSYPGFESDLAGLVA